MAAFEWKELYSVGNPTLDAQHKRLFAIANHYCEAYNRGGGKRDPGAIFSDLIDYTE